MSPSHGSPPAGGATQFGACMFGVAYFHLWGWGWFLTVVSMDQIAVYNTAHFHSP